LKGSGTWCARSDKIGLWPKSLKMRYHIVSDGEWVKPRMKKHYMRCCDCGLVHVLDFKVIKHGRGHKVMFRGRRVKSKKP
jgi:hypothetical protein